MIYGTDYRKTQQLIDNWDEVAENSEARTALCILFCELNYQLEELRDEIQDLRKENERLESVVSSLEYRLDRI